MKKILFLAIAITTAITVAAQAPKEGSYVIRPMVGFNLASHSAEANIVTKGKTTFNMNSEYRRGFTAGVEVGYQMKKWFQPSVGLFYSQQGSIYDMNYPLVHAKPKMQFDYLIAPILANFYVWKGLAIKAGIQPGLLIRSSASENVMEYDASDFTRKFQLQIPAGVSYQYKNVIVDARVFIPVMRVYHSKDLNRHLMTADAGLRSAVSDVFSLSLGYSFEFGKSQSSK